MTTELTPADTMDEALPHAELIGGWLASLTSENTRRAYRRDLAGWLSWLSVAGIDLLQARRVHLDTWRATLRGAESTRARKLSAVSSFYAYALARDAVPGNPVAAVKRPRVNLHDSTTQGLTEAEARALLHAAVKHSPRANALIRLLLTTGIRVSEALCARRSAIKHASGAHVLEVTRKGGTRGRVTITPGVAKALETYLGESIDVAAVAQRGDDEDPFLFTTTTGHQWAQSEAYRTVRQAAERAGIPGRISPHSLRHTYATLALDNGVALRDVQDFMGHNDPSTTRHYDRSRNRLDRDPALTLSRIFG